MVNTNFFFFIMDVSFFFCSPRLVLIHFKLHFKVHSNFLLQPCTLSHFLFSLENCNLHHCWLDYGKYLVVVKPKFTLQAVELLGKTSQFHQCFMIVIITLSTLYFAFLIHAIFSLEIMMMMIMIKMMMITMMMMIKWLGMNRWRNWRGIRKIDKARHTIKQAKFGIKSRN